MKASKDVCKRCLGDRWDNSRALDWLIDGRVMCPTIYEGNGLFHGRVQSVDDLGKSCPFYLEHVLVNAKPNRL